MLGLVLLIIVSGAVMVIPSALSSTEKATSFLREFYVDGDETGKNFVYGQQLVSLTVYFICDFTLDLFHFESWSLMNG